MEEKTYEELERDDIKKYPYAIYHPDDDETYPRPKFSTWREALDQQKQWNKELPGHRAYKRRVL